MPNLVASIVAPVEKTSPVPLPFDLIEKVPPDTVVTCQLFVHSPNVTDPKPEAGVVTVVGAAWCVPFTVMLAVIVASHVIEAIGLWR